MSATIGRLDTELHRGDRRLELGEIGERLDEEEVDAAPFEHACLLGVDAGARRSSLAAARSSRR